MSYNIEIPERVAMQIKEHALYIAKDKPSVALQWYDEIYNKITTLSAFPLRCPLALEDKHLGFGWKKIKNWCRENPLGFFNLLREIQWLPDPPTAGLLGRFLLGKV